MFLHGIKLEAYAVTQVEKNFTVNLISSLKIGGAWAIPRSGLVYTKTDDKTLKLSAIMPQDAVPTEMAGGLRQNQASDHHALKAAAAELGYVIDESLVEEHAKEGKYDPNG